MNGHEISESFDVVDFKFVRIAYMTFVVYLEIEHEMVDGDGVLPGVVLLHPCQEGLSEVEPTHPEHWRGALLVPVLRDDTHGQKLLAK